MTRAGTTPQTLQAAMERLHQSGMPGVIVDVDCVDDAHSRWRGAAGLADLDRGIPMEVDLHHRVGSIAKTFTAVALLRLVETGQVDLDAAIGRYLPDLVTGARGDAITVRMLAQHTSGLAEYLPIIYSSLRSFPDLSRTSPHSLEEHRLTHFDRRCLIRTGTEARETGRPGSLPGAYSNTNYLLLAELIERVTGIAAEEWITKEVIERAQLSGTFFPTGTRLEVPHARLYESWFTMLDPPRDLSEFDMSWVGTAASLVSTAEDLQRFFGMLIDGELVRPESLRAMQSTVPVITFERTKIEYGLGLHRQSTPDGTVFWGHDGSVWGGGAITLVRADGRRRLTVLTNRQRWNRLDERGRPVPHAIDEAMSGLLDVARG